MPGPPRFEVADYSEPQPLAIEEFVDQIDTRGGYFQGAAKSVENFQDELKESVKAVVKDKEFTVKIAEQKGISMETFKQLVSVLSLPPEGGDELKEKYYPEDHRSPGAIGQDELVPHIIQWFEDKSYHPQSFTEKKYKQLLDLTKHFVFYEGQLYRRGKESQHHLYVQKEHRM